MADIKAIITFHGTNPESAEQAFKDSVDDYLEWCTERGKEPEKMLAQGIGK